MAYNKNSKGLGPRAGPTAVSSVRAAKSGRTIKIKII